MDINQFKEIVEKSVLKEHIDQVEIKKGKFLNYVSWAKAYKIAMEYDTKMTFIIHEQDGFPAFEKHGFLFVKTSVTMFGETKSIVLPVMDSKHNSKHLTPYEIKWSTYVEKVSAATGRDINDAIMRCLTKNIALFGIGLKLYMGEDLDQYLFTPDGNNNIEPKKPELTVPFDKNKIIEKITKKIEDTVEPMETYNKIMIKYGFKEIDNFTMFSVEQLKDCATKFKINI